MPEDKKESFKKIAKKIPGFLNIILALSLAVVLVVITYNVASQLDLISGFPKGRDAYAYLTKIKYILEYFPNVFWNPFWDSGTPTWLWSYPPAAMHFAALITRLFNQTPEFGLSWMAFASFAVFALGIFGFIFNISKNVVLAFLISLILIFTPATWGWWADGGNYVRVYGLASLGLFLFFYSGYLIYRNRIFFFGTVFSFALALTAHLLIGGLVFLLHLLTTIFYPANFGKKFVEGMKILLFSFLLSAYWILPLLLTAKPQSRFFGGARQSSSLSDLLALNQTYPFFSWPQFLMPVLLAIVVLVTLSLLFMALRKFRNFPRLNFAFLLTTFTMALFFTFYLFAAKFSFWPEKLFIDGLPPLSAFVLPTIFSIIFLGVAFSFILKVFSFRFSAFLLILPFIPAVFWILVSGSKIIDTSKPQVADVSWSPTSGKMAAKNIGAQWLVQKLILNSPKDPKYRFGTDYALVSDWFNYFYPNISQTRDFFAQGVTYPQWQYFLEKTVWGEDQDKATRFLLDWYAVKNFYVGELSFRADKFLKNPDDYQVVKTIENKEEVISRRTHYEFIFRNPTPIIYPTNAKTALVFSDKESYETLFRDLAFLDLNSRKFIPILASHKIENYKDEDLSSYDFVFLYGYQGNLHKIADKLKRYIQGGGVVFIEANQSLETGKDLPDPYPIIKEEIKEKNGSWNFKSDETFGKIDFSIFGPPQYQNNPWRLAIGKNVKSWAKPILSDDNGNLIVLGRYGKGKIIWSGLNLPFHLSLYQNRAEIELFGELISILDSNIEPSIIGQDFQYNFITTQKREIVLNEFYKGIIFKESFFPNWHAQLANGRKIDIKKAGPYLMYVQLPRDLKFPSKIIFEYRLSFLEKFSFFLSILSFAILIYYLITGNVLPHTWKKFILDFRPYKIITGWWERDEE